MAAKKKELEREKPQRTSKLIGIVGKLKLRVNQKQGDAVDRGKGHGCEKMGQEADKKKTKTLKKRTRVINEGK